MLGFVPSGCSGDDGGSTTATTDGTATLTAGSAGTDGTDSVTGGTATAGTDSNTGGTATAGTASGGSGGTTGGTDSSGGGTDSGGTSNSGTGGSSGTGGGSTGGGDSTGGGSTGGGSTSGGSTGGVTAGSSGGSTGGGPPGDADNDGIPDTDDPFPMDDTQPQTATPYKVYAHTSSTLYTMDVDAPYDITLVGGFTYDQSPGSMTDVAVDRWGVLYGITFNDLFVCNAQTAECFYLADLPATSTNGLTMIPPGIIDPLDDTLVAIANNGDWHQVILNGNVANFMQIGSYTMGLTSSGDAFSIAGVGTYGSVNKAGASGNVIVESNPMNGNVTQELAELTGYTTVYGVAGWEGKIFAFESGGDVILVDPQNPVPQVIKTSNNAWWGAGVGTVLPQ